MNTQTSRMDSSKQKKSKTRRTERRHVPIAGANVTLGHLLAKCGHIFFHKQLSIVEDWTMLGDGRYNKIS